MKTEPDPIRTYECFMCHVEASFMAKPGLSPVAQAQESGWRRIKNGWLCPKDHRPPLRRYGHDYS